MDNNEIIINAKNFVNYTSKIIATHISVGIGLYHHHTI